MTPRKKKPPAPKPDIAKEISAALAQRPARAKPGRHAAQPPQVGDKVTIGDSETVFEIAKLRRDGSYVDLEVPGTNLDRFNVDVDTLKWVERKAPRATTPAKPSLDADAIAQRIATIQRENLQRLDDDIALLTKYLKAEGAPKAAINTLEALSSQQHESWHTAVDEITDLLKK